MKCKLKQPSQESINKVFIEMLLKSNDLDLNYEWLKNQENVILNYRFCVKDLLEKAEFIENFGECKSS